ncbi:hypothetical protein [Actinoallomurus iriomotensis]|uniref:Uncharacterized protein n=1 Tax=Actinoallomurus iriomotensis TaxID=478107 RepID=A0A9W6RQY1_9ACTN|nr:hypothetical protein [Actinoallomurus iriomotensis]GLY79905.1 hypothetical protein Airi01_081720 [Actinoallomurus iriomotensis]
MRYRGSRRQAEVAAADSRGRHRRSKDAGGPDRTSRADGTSEPSAERPRRLQPRDALGRFRKIEPADLRAVEHPGDVAADARAKPRYTWRDFELDEDLPRAAPHPPDAVDLRDGRRNCGTLESILYRQWAADGRSAPADAVRAIDSLAELPDALKDKLADGLDGIYVGSGGVPDLDDMQYLRGAPLPGGKATWDICAGAYGDRKIVVGDQPSPTPDVMLHEVGHALDDIDGEFVEDGSRQWQSDSPEFRALYEQCVPHFASDFHITGDDLGRHEFFADAFAAIASRQRPALVDMLGGNTRAALNVMLFFNRKYGI